MQQQKASQSDDEVVEIKHSQEQCAHRIVDLYCHPNCQKSAQICEKLCNNSLAHDIAKYFHDRKSVQQFKAKFTHLESTSNRQTQHYIRQLDQIQRNAIDNIAKKKAECLREIKEFKKDLMKLTYTDLASKFPHLYEKFKNQRFDTLTCNEVSWVMKMQLHHHNQKHSVINSKLVGILKKFEGFKDVSKNLMQKVTINKQKAKDIKLITKSPILQHVVKLKSNAGLEKPNYSNDKLKDEIKYLQQKKKQLQASIKYLNQRNNILSDQISNKIFAKRQKQNKVRLNSNLVQYHIQNINQKSASLINNAPINVMKPSTNNRILEQSDSASLSSEPPRKSQNNFNIDQRVKVMWGTNIKTTTINKPFGTLQNKVEIRPPEAQRDKTSNQKVDEMQEALEKKEKQIVNKQNDKKPSQQRQESRQNQQNREIKETSIFQKQEKQVKKTKEKGKIAQLQVQVKQQQIQIAPFQIWKNTELVEQIKKFGKTEEQCLKVQNIDGLRSFETVRLPSTKLKINPIFKRMLKGQTSPAKPKEFQDLAKMLLQSQVQSQKQKQDKKPF